MVKYLDQKQESFDTLCNEILFKKKKKIAHKFIFIVITAIRTYTNVGSQL